MSVAQFVRTRVEFGRMAAGLAAGDVLAIAAFATLGAAHHGESVLSNPAHVGLVAVPFLLGWALAALLGGLYTPDAISTPRRVASWTVPAWIVATLVGQGLRATPLIPGGTAPAFVAVTLVVGGALVVGWRLAASLLVG